MTKIRFSALVTIASLLLMTMFPLALAKPKIQQSRGIELGLDAPTVALDARPIYNAGPRYTFGQAKANQHPPYETTYGLFVRNGLVPDPTNNGGNAFLGNTITVRQGMRRTVTYWFDWSADPQAVRKLSVWGNSIGMLDPLTIVYDPRTMLVISVTSPRIVPGPF